MRKYVIGAAFLLAAVVLPVVSAHADTITYTFTGVGSGTINSTAFTDDAFTFVLTGNTTNISTSGAPFYYLYDLGGTFSEGSYTTTLSPTILLASNAAYSSTTGAVGFFDSTITDGLGLVSSALDGYGLSTAVGPVTGTLIPTLGGGGFAATDGDTISITGNTSLSFTAAVPEPATSSLMMIGVGMLVLMAAMRKRKAHGLAQAA